MDIVRISEWLQVIAAVGVLLGLLLVAYELRQNHQLARTQLGSETLTAYQEILDSFQEETTARAYAKALEAPGSLTLDEQIILHALFTEIVSGTVIRHQYMIARGVFPPNLSIQANSAARLILDSEYGRQWWSAKKGKQFQLPLVNEAMDIAETEIESSLMDSAASIKERAQQNLEQQL